MPGDLHSGLRTERRGETTSAGVTFTLVGVQRGKTDFAFGLHADPRQHTLNGVQTPDLLSHLGFSAGQCAFMPGGRCLAREVSEDFDVTAFGSAFDKAWSSSFKAADGHLTACGLPIAQPVGWAFSGPGGRAPSDRRLPRPLGDGHTAPQTRKLNESADGVFRYVFSWLSGGSQKGWTLHYGPKHPPLSAEIESALQFLGGFELFPECPEFEFDPCRWRFHDFIAEDSMWNRSAGYVQNFFDAHATRCAPGLNVLLDSHAAMLPFNMLLLPAAAPTRAAVTLGAPSTKLIRSPAPSRPQPAGGAGYKYDVALSFAGTERPLAEKLATVVRDAGAQVFYDEFYPEHLWGKNLPVYFDRVYRKESRFCVIFVSVEYSKRAWTYLELRSALARALQERGNEYILPIRIEAVDLEGVPPTLGYLDIASYPIEKIAEMLLRKLRE